MNGIRPISAQQADPPLDLLDQYIVSDTGGTGYGTGYGSDGRVDMAMIRAVLYRQKWIILFSLILTLLAGVIYTVMQTPIYQADTTVRVDPQGSYILEGQDLAPGIHVNEYRQYLETLGTVVRSRKMAETVAANLKLGDDPAFLPADIEASRPANLSDKHWQARKQAIAASALRGGVDVDIPFETRIMTISYRSTDRQTAAKLANGFAEAFLAEDARRNLDTNTYALEYLSEQIADIKEELQAAELASNAYARNNQLVGATPIINEDTGENTGSTTISAQTLSGVNSAYNTARTNRIEAQQRWRAVANIPATQLPQVQNNSTVQALLTDKTKAQAELADLRQRYKDGYPVIQELQSRIATLNRQITRSSSDIKASLRNDYRIAQRQENALKAELNRVSGDNLEEQDLQVRYGLLERDAAALRDQLAALLSRYNELSAASNLQTGSISLLDSASIPVSPISPSLMRNLLIALIAGLGLAVMLSVLREALDDRLRSVNDVERKLGVGLLGHTPFVADSDLADDTSNPFSALTEAYASIRSTIDYVVPRDQKVLQFTSSQASEGKTTSAVMVAQQMARLGHKTLLVDADLRRPSVHALMGLSRPKTGFVEVLTGNAALAEALLPDTPDCLDVIGVSKPPPNPVELLSSQMIADFIAKNRDQYERIIFDTSPVMGIADAPLLSSHVDATIFVAEANRVHGGQAKAAVRRLRGVGANLVGVVLTKFKALEAGQNYGAEYRYYTYSGQD